MFRIEIYDSMYKPIYSKYIDKIIFLPIISYKKMTA